MSSHTFEQFVRFTTDAAGLERTFRLFQATAQILSSYTLPFNILLLLLSYFPSISTAPPSTHTYPDAATTHAVLVGLRTRFNLARRYFRLFRFLESFHAAQKLHASIHSGSTRTSSSSSSSSSSKAGGGSGGGSVSRWGNAPLWIDVFGRTFNGMYLLLEASTILDVQRIDGLAVWGPELEPLVTVEGQRFWLFSLACGVLAGLLRITDLVMPYVAEKQVSVAGKEGESVDEKSEGGVDEKAGSDKGTKVDQLVRRQEVRARISNLGRRVVSDALDITLPGSVVGWVPASTGTVGLAMFITTILTSMDIWERCGREVANNRK